MPPKKKADIKANKNNAKAKAKANKSQSKSPQPKNTSKSKPSKAKPNNDKSKVEIKKNVSPAKPAAEPVKGRRTTRQPSPVADQTPAKKTKKQIKTPSKELPSKNLSASKSKDAKLDKSVQKKGKPQIVKTDAKKDDKKDATAIDDDKQIITMVTKGGAAVDNYVPEKQNYRVFQQAGINYAATLNKADLAENNNKFYIVQMLLNQKTGSIHVWNRWGRVGVQGQHMMKGPFTKDKALNDYNSKIRDKKSGGYRQIQIKYDDEQQEKPKEQAKPKKQNNVASKMDPAIQKLISLIFDVTVMNNTMKQIGYDAKKMPLGKLGDGTIRQAYAVLNKLTQAIKDGKTSQYSKLSGQFYTLIPHNIGFDKMSKYILDNDEKVKQKLRMLEAISDMKITSKLLDQQGDQDTSVHDQNYKKLGCQIKALDKKSKDFKVLQEYFQNTKGMYNKVTIGDIYQIQRPAQHTSFDKKIGNNMLLWHGSRIANFVGILSQGLRIAPPQAPVSGYLFGKGIYLADLAQKSINYCRSGASPKALILLIQGALGNPNILLSSSYQAKQLMQKNGRNSTKCHGAKAPPQSCYVNMNGFIVPNGKPVPTGSGSYMGHNEFIVYNINQARIRYVLEMNMNGG